MEEKLVIVTRESQARLSLIVTTTAVAIWLWTRRNELPDHAHQTLHARDGYHFPP